MTTFSWLCQNQVVEIALTGSPITDQYQKAENTYETSIIAKYVFKSVPVHCRSNYGAESTDKAKPKGVVVDTQY